MNRLFLVVFLLCFGCSSEPPKPLRFQEGQTVYHKLDGRPMIVEFSYFNDRWYCRYSNNLGDLVSDSFGDAELTETAPRERGDN